MPKALAATALAAAGDDEAAASHFDDLARRYQVVRSAYGHIISGGRARMALVRGKPAEAVALLQPLGDLEFGADPSVIVAYGRAQALLASGAAREAAAAFQKLIDNRGTYPLVPHNVLAWLGLGRARAAAGDPDGAREAYDRFLEIWKDADPDAPVLLEARAERARLGT